MLLDKVASVYRKVYDGTEYVDTPVYANIACAIIPISNFDMAIPYARESTHVLWVAHWLVLHKEDMIHWGRQEPNPQNDIRPFIYTINGKQRPSLGMARSTYFVRELD